MEEGVGIKWIVVGVTLLLRVCWDTSKKRAKALWIDGEGRAVPRIEGSPVGEARTPDPADLAGRLPKWQSRRWWSRPRRSSAGRVQVPPGESRPAWGAQSGCSRGRWSRRRRSRAATRLGGDGLAACVSGRSALGLRVGHEILPSVRVVPWPPTQRRLTGFVAVPEPVPAVLGRQRGRRREEGARDVFVVTAKLGSLYGFTSLLEGAESLNRGAGPVPSTRRARHREIRH